MKKFFYRQDGGKKVLDLKKASIPVFFIGAAAVVILLFSGDSPDTSYLRKSDKSVVAGGLQEPAKVTESEVVRNILKNSKTKEGTAQRDGRPQTGRRAPLNYRAKQVIEREGDPTQTMPIGSNFIGKILMDLDSRENGQMVKVILPYGGKIKGSPVELPKETLLMGQLSYPGHGDKVFINFNRGVLSNGKEFNISAQALSPKDFAPGLTGEHHGTFGPRLASTLGLTMVAGMSDVLMEKEALGQSIEPTPKATMKNALLHGTSQVAQAEANRHAQELGNSPEYVTISEGADLIVSLTKAFQP